jgi:hypothetical protein
MRIDRRFRDVGRINLASGTTDPKQRTRYERMLSDLYDQGRLDILRAIKARQVTFASTYDAYKRQALHELPVGDAMPLVADSMKAWIAGETNEYSSKHLVALETSRRYFERANKKARIADLPKVLEQLRKTLGIKHPRSFNLARAHALAFVRATLKRSHPVYISCAAVEARKVAPSAPRAYHTPDAMRGNFPHPETDAVDAIAWALMTTGMGTKEYYGPWHVESDRVVIGGTKRKGRLREVPLVRVPAVAKISRDWFEKSMRKRFSGTITPYDLRRTYSRWMESAGVPRTRRRLYMGHGSKDVTDQYERHEVAAFVKEDAVKIAAFLTIPVPTSPVSSPTAIPSEA